MPKINKNTLKKIKAQIAQDELETIDFFTHTRRR